MSLKHDIEDRGGSWIETYKFSPTANWNRRFDLALLITMSGGTCCENMFADIWNKGEHRHAYPKKLLPKPPKP